MAGSVIGKGGTDAYSSAQQKFQDIVNAAKTKQQAKWGINYKPKASKSAVSVPVSQPVKTRFSDAPAVSRYRGGFYV